MLKRRRRSPAAGPTVPLGRSRAATLIVAGAALAIALAGCTNSGNNPPPTPARALSIGAPLDGQVLAGMASLAAAGINGRASSVSFEIASVSAAADPTGAAFIDTTELSDGPHTLTASGVVGGEPVSASVSVVVNNDLGSSGTVGPAGGALRSENGSIATLLPGALTQDTPLALADTTEQEIFDRFGIDYSDLGVTFLGALTIEGPTGESPGLPVQVELAGWAEAVQPNHSVVMFSTLPDADGDGVGELVYAADARVAPNGSVVTVPAARAEVHGFGTAATVAAQGISALQAATSAKPGAIVTLVGRGFNASGRLSNVVRWTDSSGDPREVLAWARVAGDDQMNPTFELRFAVPAAGSGPLSVTLHNLTTGFRTESMTIDVGSVGSASAATWTSFVDQVEIAVEAFAAGRTDLQTSSAAWLGALRGSSDPVAAALAANSGLVSTANRNSLTAIGPSPSAAQVDLAMRHALVLDAVAASVPAIAAPAADLATLLAVSVPAAPGTGGLSVAQAGGTSCTGTASPSTTSIVIGNPTGMGSAPPGGCISGNASGGGGSGPTALSGSVDPATVSLRSGSFKPLSKALIRLLRTDGTRLTAFTARTDASGYFNLPFVPPGEPFVLEGIDPATGQITRVETVSGAVDERVMANLLFPPSDKVVQEGEFSILPQPSGPFEGTWSYLFVANDAVGGESPIELYNWDFGGVSVTMTAAHGPTLPRGYGRNDTYEVSLVMVDEQGEVYGSSQQLVIDDLPYDYWGEPPERVDVAAQGLLPNAETMGGVHPSADGRYMTFVTEASNLGPNDTNGLPDLYLKDMLTGEVELISGAAAGKEVWRQVAMTPDARFIAYTEEDTPPHGVGPNRIVVVDRELNTSENFTNPAGRERNVVVALSDDGTKLLYYASTLNVSESPAWVRDLASGEEYRVGASHDGTGYVQVTPVALSGDGRHVVLESRLPGLIEINDSDAMQVYVTDIETGETQRASETADGVGSDRESRTYASAISQDGRYVVFYSEATNFPGAPTTGGYTPDQAYLKDLQTGELELISANAAGQAGDESSVLPQVSDDGRYVAFGSYAYNLTPLMDSYDTCVFGCPQGFSYVKDRLTGRVALVSVGLNDATPNDWDQIEPQLSATGEYLVFYSWATNLVEGGSGATGQSYYYRARNPLWE